MRVSILTWEYPPRIIGELSTYAKTLAQVLSGHGFEVHVVTFHDTLRGEDREPSGVYVHRVANPVSTHINILTWDLALSCEFERVCADIFYDIGRIDLVDCHEWLCVVAATTIKRAFGTPFVITLDSLEEQRSNFNNTPLNLAIQSIERTGTHEAVSVLVKSEQMKTEVLKLHSLDSRKVRVIPRVGSFEGVDGLYEKFARTHASV